MTNKGNGKIAFEDFVIRAIDAKQRTTRYKCVNVQIDGLDALIMSYYETDKENVRKMLDELEEKGVIKGRPCKSGGRYTYLIYKSSEFPEGSDSSKKAKELANEMGLEL